MTKQGTKSLDRPRPVEASIEPSRLYRSDEASVRMGWTPSAWRAARHAGLTVYQCGKHVFVHGSDLITFATSRKESSK